MLVAGVIATSFIAVKTQNDDCESVRDELPLRGLGDVLVNPRSHARSPDCLWGNLPVRFAWCALVVLASAGSV